MPSRKEGDFTCMIKRSTYCSTVLRFLNPAAQTRDKQLARYQAMPYRDSCALCLHIAMSHSSISCRRTTMIWCGAKRAIWCASKKNLMRLRQTNEAHQIFLRGGSSKNPRLRTATSSLFVYGEREAEAASHVFTCAGLTSRAGNEISADSVVASTRH